MMGTLLPFVRPGRLSLVKSGSSALTFPRFAREKERPSLPLRPAFHTTETDDDRPLR